jgi:cytochrome c
MKFVNLLCASPWGPPPRPRLWHRGDHQEGPLRGLSCRRPERVGPAYKDVAAKYKGQADAVAVLSAKVRNGGAGNWGQIPMPPWPDKISDADLKAAVEWILKL